MERTKIIVPLCGSFQEILSDLQELRKSRLFAEVDVFEFRADLCPEYLETDDSAEQRKKILKEIHNLAAPAGLLFTIRTSEQGGQFSFGSAYEKLIQEAISSGQINFVDLEGLSEREGMVLRLVRDAQASGIRTILSYHDFRETPEYEAIQRLFRRLRSFGGDILKTAFMPQNASDVLRLMSAARAFREEDGASHEYISMSMGNLGRISRTAGLISGSDYTFASFRESSAPGQLSLREEVQILRIYSGWQPDIALIGYMASGKSSVAAELSRLTGKSPVEMDALIEAEAGKKISEIFKTEGEESFRARETGLLIRYSGRGRILSCGGGVPLLEKNRRILKRGGAVIYLSAEPETILSRLNRNQTDRPLLAGRVSLSEIRSMLDSRMPAYLDAADISVRTDGRTVTEIAEEIIRRLPETALFG